MMKFLYGQTSQEHTSPILLVKFLTNKDVYRVDLVLGVQYLFTKFS